MTASILYIVAILSHAMIAFYNPWYKIERWHIFLSYQALNVIVLTYNVFFLNKAPWTHKLGCKLGDQINEPTLMLNQEQQSSYRSPPSL